MENEVLSSEVQEMLAKEAIEQIPWSQAQGGFYSTFFLVPKKDGGVRPILNLKPLNVLIAKKHFKMVTLREIMAAVQPGDWLISLDLKDAYFHIPIKESYRKFLRFAFQGKTYQFKVLPFGATAAPRVFTQVLAPKIVGLCCQAVAWAAWGAAGLPPNCLWSW
jgi:hypothetical protein